MSIEKVIPWHWFSIGMRFRSAAFTCIWMEMKSLTFAIASTTNGSNFNYVYNTYVHTLLHWPFKELHEQADIEDPPQNEEQTIPEANTGIKCGKVKIIVVADASDHCSIQTQDIRTVQCTTRDSEHHWREYSTADEDGERCCGERNNHRRPSKQRVDHSSNALTNNSFLHICKNTLMSFKTCTTHTRGSQWSSIICTVKLLRKPPQTYLSSCAFIIQRAKCNSRQKDSDVEEDGRGGVLEERPVSAQNTWGKPNRKKHLSPSSWENSVIFSISEVKRGFGVNRNSPSVKSDRYNGSLQHRSS